MWLHALCWLVIHFSWEKMLYMCCCVCFTLLRWVCIYLCDHPYSTTVCPLSASEYGPTLQAAPPWQHLEGQASTNTAECGDRGRWALSCWWKSMMLWRRGSRGHTDFFLPFPSTQQPPCGHQPGPHCHLLCWLLWLPWRPMSGGLDFLTKPSRPRAVTAAHGQCARPKLTQLMSQNLTKKKRPNYASFSEWSKSPAAFNMLLSHHILYSLRFSLLKQMMW